MQKLFAIILTVCLMIGAFCITAFAADAPADDIVLRVSALKKDGTTVVIKDYTIFEDGWNAAMELADNSKEMNKNDYARVIVDIYADWNANEDGEFTEEFFNGKGFNWDAIYFRSNIRMTLNLNGHTINRGLTEWEYNGEVMYIDENADVIINDGTITGGFSCNGAGGIHINDGANVTLNNVSVVGNNIEDDNGAGIAVYDGATLTMNDGCVSNNTSYSTSPAVYGGGVYIEDASASFKGVTFENNQSVKFATHGAAVYVDDGILLMENCQVIGNGLNSGNHIGAASIVDIKNDSKTTIINTNFLMNGYAQDAYVSLNTYRYSSVIKILASSLTMNGCTFTDNNQVYLIDSEAAMLNIQDSDFSGNRSFAFYGNCANVSDNTFTNCVFSYNEPMLNLDNTFYFNLVRSNLKFIDCDFGEATFNDRGRVAFEDSVRGKALGVGSVFSEGSLTTIVSLLAIVVSVASISVNLSHRKNKASETEEQLN